MKHGTYSFRPIFWFKNDDKKEYEKLCNIIHSDCYTKYGLKRTGCAGCPFWKERKKEIEELKKNEPKLYKAVMNIFGESYYYTNKYNEFKDKQV